MLIKEKRNKNKINGYSEEMYAMPEIRHHGSRNGDKGGLSLNKCLSLERREKWSVLTHYENESAHCLVISQSLRPYRLWNARLLCPWNSPSKNTGVGRHPLLQGIFPNQGSNLGLLHCRPIILPSKPPGKPSSLLYLPPIT